MNNLKALRKTRGLSQEQLAKDIGVAQNTVSNWEVGIRDIDSAKLEILTQYFNTTADYILGLSDDPTPPNKKASMPYDKEAQELIEEMYEREELRTLFSVSRNAKKEDIEAVNELIKRLNQNHEGDEE